MDNSILPFFNALGTDAIILSRSSTITVGHLQFQQDLYQMPFEPRVWSKDAAWNANYLTGEDGLHSKGKGRERKTSPEIWVVSLKMKAVYIIQRSLCMDWCQKLHSGDGEAAGPYHTPPKLLGHHRRGAEKKSNRQQISRFHQSAREGTHIWQNEANAKSEDFSRSRSEALLIRPNERRSSAKVLWVIWNNAKLEEGMVEVKSTRRTRTKGIHVKIWLKGWQEEYDLREYSTNGSSLEAIHILEINNLHCLLGEEKVGEAIKRVYPDVSG